MQCKEKGCPQGDPDLSQQHENKTEDEKTGQDMTHQIGGPESPWLQPPQLIVHEISDVNKGSVVSRMPIPFFNALNRPVLLSQIGYHGLNDSDERILCDKRNVIQDESTCQRGKVYNAAEETDEQIGPPRALTYFFKGFH
jgi:hypothetical protein